MEEIIGHDEGGFYTDSGYVGRFEEVKTVDQARQQAMDWQVWQSEQSLSYGQLSAYLGHFEELAKEFNLTEEFKENGII